MRERWYEPGVHFSVRHETVYRYSVPVQLATHWVRLTPRHDGAHVAWHAIDAQPTPSTLVEHLDAFGNRVSELGFIGSTQLLRVESRFELDTVMLPPLAAPLPALPWPTNAEDGLQRFRHGPFVEGGVALFASELARHVDNDALAFLDRLTAQLFERTDKQLRTSGDAQPAATTLASRQGSCRDLTVLFMAACRSLGIASRFTSGYLAPADGLDVSRELHAWPEAFIPGTGWRGFDPSIGARVLDAHVALCAAPSQDATMPIEGGYYFEGPSVTTTLDFDLRIDAR